MKKWTLEENIRAILECNFSIAREEVIESATKRIMEQISTQNPLKDIKAEIEELEYEDFDCNLVLPAWKVYDIMKNYISEVNHFLRRNNDE